MSCQDNDDSSVQYKVSTCEGLCSYKDLGSIALPMKDWLSSVIEITEETEHDE